MTTNGQPSSAAAPTHQIAGTYAGAPPPLRAPPAAPPPIHADQAAMTSSMAKVEGRKATDAWNMPALVSSSQVYRPTSAPAAW